MAGPSGRVKAICIVASAGHLLISSLSNRLLLTLSAEMSEHIVPVWFNVLPPFWQWVLSDRQIQETLSVTVHVSVTQC